MALGGGLLLLPDRLHDLDAAGSVGTAEIRAPRRLRAVLLEGRRDARHPGSEVARRARLDRDLATEEATGVVVVLRGARAGAEGDLALEARVVREGSEVDGALEPGRSRRSAVGV